MHMPTVTYKKLSPLAILTVGLPAIVWPLDHPSLLVSNDRWAATSPVEDIAYDEEGAVRGFTTRNSVYVPA